MLVPQPVAMSLGLASLVIVLVIGAGAVWVPNNSRNVIINAPDRTQYHCATLLLGRKTEDEIQLKQRVVGAHDYLFIANYCSGQQKKLAGEYVKVCDSVGAYPPSVSQNAGRFSPLRVDCPLQNEPCSELLYADVTLYCEPAAINLNKL